MLENPPTTIPPTTPTVSTGMIISLINSLYVYILKLIYHLEYTPVQTTTTTTTTLVTVPLFVVIILIIIVLVFLSVICVMGIALVVLYRKTQQHTHTTKPTEATHPYEYIDMDKVVEHMSPARTADDTDYIHMTNPQYSNLK